MHAGHMPLPGVSERAVDLGELPCLTQVPYRIASSERATHAHTTPHETRHYPLANPHPPRTRHQPSSAPARYPFYEAPYPPPRHPRAIPVLAHARAIPVLAHALRTPLLARAEVMRLDLRRAHCHAPPSPSLLPSHFGETRCGFDCEVRCGIPHEVRCKVATPPTSHLS
eukprot:scaffold87618_cov48-Phaeocystis_antarctica.AAC.1